jgi:lysophospholipase L1-like esterase
MRRISDSVARLGLIVLAVAVVAFTVVGYMRYQERVTEDLAAVPDIEYNAPEPPLAVLVVGDSYTAGSAMNNGPEWPDIIAAERNWAVGKDAVGGTGYLAGAGERPTFLDRVDATVKRYSSDLILVAGGINDIGKFPNAAIAEAAAKEVRALRDGIPDAQVVLFSEFNTGRPSQRERDLAGQLRATAEAEGVEYVDVTGALPQRLVGIDGVHPTDAGHEQLAKRIARLLDRVVSTGAR